MIVKPSVTELLEKVEDRYELVAITSKRARQIASGDSVLTDSDEKSPVTLAAIEIAEGKVSQADKKNEEEQEKVNVEQEDN